MEQGLVEIYYGDGKGKTTAAAGLCARAAGQGLRAGFFQFLKGRASGEQAALAALGVRVSAPRQSEKFVFQMSAKERAETARIQDANLAAAALAAPGLDLLVLDEALTALGLGVLDRGALLRLTREKPAGLELVITGHQPDAELFELADYITRLTAERHPYERGIGARRGIEY